LSTGAALAPGATIGILGGGQLARMMGFEAVRLGYRVAVLDPDPACPAAAVATVVAGRLDDHRAAARLAALADAVTIDTEHVPAPVLAAIETTTRVWPTSEALATLQDRLTQKTFLARIGAPQARFFAVHDAESLTAAIDAVGTPAVLKTRRGGYDGRGQAMLQTPLDAGAAWRALGAAPAVLESWVPFHRELSVVLARDSRGNVCTYALAENLHRNHILHISAAPADIAPALERRARDLAATIAEQLGLVGVVTLELFDTGDDLLVNEIAPRVHNSGHFTFGACVTSQFAQHVRAIAGLPLGDTTQLAPAAIVNLLGDLWDRGEPDWRPLLREPRTALHLYGKRVAHPGRKMGHALVVGTSAAAARARAEAIHARLRAPALDQSLATANPGA